MASITPMSFFTPDASINPDEYTFEIVDASARNDIATARNDIATARNDIAAVSGKAEYKVLWWGSYNIANTNGVRGTLATITDAGIIGDHILDKFVPANPSVIVSGISCNTTTGQAVLTGTSTAATTAEIKLVKKDN